MPALDKDQYTKAEAAELIRVAEESAAEALDVAKREADMTDAEKEVYKSLEGDAKSEFLFASHDERKVTLTKALDDNPVIYKSANGDEFRKSDDPRLVKMAKDRDEERKSFMKMQAEREQEQFEKRASDELPNLPGDVKVRAEILKSISSIKDEAMRDEAIKALKAHNARMGKALQEVGEQGGGDNGGESAFATLDKMAKELQKSDANVDYYTAFERVSGTNPELAKRAAQEG